MGSDQQEVAQFQRGCQKAGLQDTQDRDQNHRDNDGAQKGPYQIAGVEDAGRASQIFPAFEPHPVGQGVGDAGMKGAQGDGQQSPVEEDGQFELEQIRCQALSASGPLPPFLPPVCGGDRGGVRVMSSPPRLNPAMKAVMSNPIQW
jgi:hypothetical protein